jgi:protein-L-isoaspartate(D-aspartate) O-methyltransferase
MVDLYKTGRVVLALSAPIWLSGLAAKGAEQRDTDDARWARERRGMVADQIKARGISDVTVLSAMERVPRHLFVPHQYRDAAYEDSPLPIGSDQTISQPYIVAYMTQALGIDRTKKVLEIGTGSGYQAAVLAEIVKEVYTIEIVEDLGKRAAALLKELGYRNVHTRIGDGYKGWPEHAPFDAIVVTAAPDHIPQPLVDQLAVGGRMVIPVGRGDQEMVIVSKTPAGVVEKRTIAVRFVPLRRGM